MLGEEHFLVASTIEGAFVFETTDAGASWSFALDSGAGGFHDFDRLPDGTLVAVSTEGDIFRSTDDGASWANTIDAVAPPRAPHGALAIGPGGTGAAGTTGTPGLQWYRTTDDGENWALQPSGPAIAFTREIAWWNADTAVVAGDLGKMWRTTDGGESWVFAVLPSAPANGSAWHLALPAPGIAFAAVTGQTQSLVYRTTDFGASWTPRSSGIAASGGLTSVSFVTAEIGFACGYASGGQPRMFRTTDGGGSWSPVGTSGITGFPWDTHWHDQQVGLATVYVSGGGIFRTTNGGASWQQRVAWVRLRALLRGRAPRRRGRLGVRVPGHRVRHRGRRRVMGESHAAFDNGGPRDHGNRGWVSRRRRLRHDRSRDAARRGWCRRR